MTVTLPFNDHVAEYEAWYKKYPFVFKSEVMAIDAVLPKGKDIHGIEIGLATGQFSKALRIKEGIEPAENMREVAKKRKIFVLNAIAEKLPYKSMQFDFVLMNFCISYFESLSASFSEAYRVLKRGGCIIVGFIDKNSSIGVYYRKRKHKSLFYRHARFYSIQKVQSELKKAGFIDLQFSQTLFHHLDKIHKVEVPAPGYGKGSFVVIKAVK